MSSAYVHAALLLHFAKQPVNEENLKKVLSAGGITIDESKVKALTSAIAEVNIEEAIKSAPIGFAPPTPAAQSEAKPKAEEKKKEKEEKKKDEEALAGLGALFG